MREEGERTKKKLSDWEKPIEKNERKRLGKQRRKESDPLLTMTVRWRGYSGKRKEWNGRSDN